MTITTTTRFGLTRWSADGDSPVRSQFDADAAAIESLGAGFTSGTLAARPAASSAVARWFYLATDTGSVGTLYWCDGTTWQLVPTKGNDLDFGLKLLSKVYLSNYAELVETIAVSGSTCTLDFSTGPIKDVTLSTNCTFSFSNWPATGYSGTMEVIVRNGASAFTATWPAAVKWAGGSPPALSGVNKADQVSLETINGGTTLAGTAVANFSGF